jgi:acetamidase/formamidase
VALQPGKGKIEGKHYLPSTPETVLWGELPTARTRPVLTVDTGATVTIDTVSQEGILEDQGRDPDAFFGGHGVAPSEVLEDARAIAASGIPHRFGIDGPHVVTGPVFVRGAEPGDVLRVEVLSLLPRARYGMISNRHGQGLLAGEFPAGPAPDEDADARHWRGFRTVGSFCAVERRRGKLFGALEGAVGSVRVRFPLVPFMGIMAVAMDLGGEPGGDGLDADAGAATVPSTAVGLHGGALDCGELGAGARLYLPVQVPGALFAVGDPHYAAGEGKVGQTALEGPLRATFRLTTLREPAARAALGSLREPFVETEAWWLTLGLDVDVTEAMRRAARSAVLFLSSRLGLDSAAALAYLSAAADFGISQIVNGVQTAYCKIRRSDFSEQAASRPRLPRAALGRLVGNGDDGGPEGVGPDGDVEAVPLASAADGEPYDRDEAGADGPGDDGTAPDRLAEPASARPAPRAADQTVDHLPQAAPGP